MLHGPPKVSAYIGAGMELNVERAGSQVDVGWGGQCACLQWHWHEVDVGYLWTLALDSRSGDVTVSAYIGGCKGSGCRAGVPRHLLTLALELHV